METTDQRSKSVLLVLPPDSTQNNPTSIISRVVLFFHLVFILCATEFQGAHLPCSHVNFSAFLKHHSTYLQDNENIELCDVARAFVQISGNGPRSKKFGYPCGRPTWRSTILTKMSYLINGHEHLSVHSPEDLATYRENEHRQLR